MLARPKRAVRTFVFVVMAVCALARGSVIIGVPRSMRSWFHPHAPFCCPNILSTTCRRSCWPCTNSVYVCIAACELELEGVIGV